MTDLDADDIRSFLLQLDILPSDTSFREFYVEQSKNVKGYYTLALYNVYVVKFYNPSRTTVHALWNQYGVKIHPDLKTHDLQVKDLPMLSFEEVTAKVQLKNSSYYFSVLHAARGKAAIDIYKRFSEADVAEQIKQKPQILSSFSQIGKSLGTFHCYHALKNPNLRTDCIKYILKIGNLNNFLTLTHNDLHPGNVFINLEFKGNSAVTLIDLESMYLSVISPSSNHADVMFFTEKLEAILGCNEGDQIIHHL